MATKGSILTADQLNTCKAAYGHSTEISTDEALTSRQKTCLWIFAITFVVMILGFIPWGSLNEGAYNAMGWTGFLTGSQLGDWWFDDEATWFVLMGIIIGLIGMPDRSKLSSTIISGIGDMIAVNLVIALARATTVLMSETGLGSWIVEASVNALATSGMPAGLFGFLDYLLHIGLSFLVPSSSGLAALSSPIVSPIVAGMNWSVETSIMCNVAANGLVNLFTPTCGFIMGGLALARIPYDVWLKWARKLLLILGVAVGVVLTVCMIILS